MGHPVYLRGFDPETFSSRGSSCQTLNQLGSHKKRTTVLNISFYFSGSLKLSWRNTSVFHPGKRLGNMPKRTFWQSLRYFTNEFTDLSLSNTSLVISFFLLQILYDDEGRIIGVFNNTEDLVSKLMERVCKVHNIPPGNYCVRFKTGRVKVELSQ